MKPNKHQYSAQPCRCGNFKKMVGYNQKPARTHEKFWRSDSLRFWRCNDWANGCWDSKEKVHNKNEWMNVKMKNEWINEWTNESMNQSRNTWLSEPTNRWNNGPMKHLLSSEPIINESMHHWIKMNQGISESMNQKVNINQCISACTHAWMKEWSNEWMNQSMNQWNNETQLLLLWLAPASRQPLSQLVRVGAASYSYFFCGFYNPLLLFAQPME